MDDVRKIIESCKDGRGVWESTWQDIALRCSTENAVFNTQMNKGEQRQQHVYDPTATIAVNRSAAALVGLMMPQGQTWHGLSTDNDYLNKDRSVQMFMDEVVRILFKMRYNPASGFAMSNNQCMRGVMAFGTAPLFVDEMEDGRGTRYRSLFLGKTYIKQNGWGRIDTFVREFELSKRDAIAEFGEDNLPEVVKQSQDMTKHTFNHVVWPNSDYEEGSRNPKKRKFNSVYCISGFPDQTFNDDGYYEFPLPIAREIPSPGEVYGRSPAMHVFPEIKMLNAMRKTTIKGVHKTVSPPLLAQSQGQFAAAGLGSNLRINMNPDGITFGAVNSQGQQMVHPLQIGADLNSAQTMIQDSRTIINDAFLLNLFQVLVETPTMTATEVLARTQERGILLAPVNAQIQTDYQSVMIEREIGILGRQGILPDIPGILQEASGEYSITYDSPLVRAQRAEQVQAINTLTQYAEGAATYDPTVMDYIDFAYNLKTIREVQGAPAQSLRSDEDVQQIRQQRQQSQQQQQLIEQAPALAGAAKDLSQSGFMQTQK